MPKRNHISSTGTFTDRKGLSRARVDYYDAEGTRRSRKSGPSRDQFHLKRLEHELVLQITSGFKTEAGTPARSEVVSLIGELLLLVNKLDDASLLTVNPLLTGLNEWIVNHAMKGEDIA